MSKKEKLKINNVYEMDIFDFLELVDDKSIDLAIIDPPYNMNKDKWDSFKNEKAYFDFTFKWIDIMLKKIKDNGSFYLFNNPYNSAIILNYLNTKNVYFKNWITWYKKDGFSASKKRFNNNQETILFYTMNKNDYIFNADDIRTPYLSTNRISIAKEKGILKNGKRWFPNEKGKLCTDVWEITSQRHVEKKHGKITKQIHPTIKPVEMIDRMILASSNKDDLILDLFSGTGTTSYCAKKNARNFIGCEKNNEYIEFINERLKK